MENLNHLYHRLSAIRPKVFLYIFLVSVAGVILISAILRALTPPPLPAEVLIKSSDSFIENLVKANTEITTDNLNIEVSNHSLYLYSTSQLNLEDFASSLADKLSLTPNPNNLPIWQNSDFTETLSIENNEIVYDTPVDIENINQLTENRISPEQSVKLFDEFIQDHQLFADYELSKPELVQVGIEGLIYEEPHNTYFIKARVLLDGLNVYVGLSPYSIAEAAISFSGQVLKIRFFPIPINTTQIQKVEVLSKEQVQANLTLSDFEVINLINPDEESPLFQKIESIDFKTGSLEYRINKENNLITPYFRLEGEAFDESGQKYLLDAITPAIEVE